LNLQYNEICGYVLANQITRRCIVLFKQKYFLYGKYFYITNASSKDHAGALRLALQPRRASSKQQAGSAAKQAGLWGDLPIFYLLP
jgi:hypothetical protein